MNGEGEHVQSSKRTGTCTVCKQTIDTGNLRPLGPHTCTCDDFYLNWHGATGPGLQLREIIANKK